MVKFDHWRKNEPTPKHFVGKDKPGSLCPRFLVPALRAHARLLRPALPPHARVPRAPPADSRGERDGDAGKWARPVADAASRSSHDFSTGGACRATCGAARLPLRRSTSACWTRSPPRSAMQVRHCGVPWESCRCERASIRACLPLRLYLNVHVLLHVRVRVSRASTHPPPPSP